VSRGIGPAAIEVAILSVITRHATKAYPHRKTKSSVISNLVRAALAPQTNADCEEIGR
jgi:hypothetical protein